MRVLVACEFSGIVREAFRQYHGVEAVSCDLLPCEYDPGDTDYHYQGNVLDILNDGWDLMIAFPPCTHLCVSGAKWFAAKRASGEQQAAIEFFMALANAPIPRIAIENPVGVMSTVYRKPDQIVQPWMFGHLEQKTTCLWLKGLPKLAETKNVQAQMQLLPRNKRERLHYLPPSKTRWMERSRTFTGLAAAMAEQWSNP